MAFCFLLMYDFSHKKDNFRKLTLFLMNLKRGNDTLRSGPSLMPLDWCLIVKLKSAYTQVEWKRLTTVSCNFRRMCSRAAEQQFVRVCSSVKCCSWLLLPLSSLYPRLLSPETKWQYTILWMKQLFDYKVLMFKWSEFIIKGCF